MDKRSLLKLMDIEKKEMVEKIQSEDSGQNITTIKERFQEKFPELGEGILEAICNKAQNVGFDISREVSYRNNTKEDLMRYTIEGIIPKGRLLQLANEYVEFYNKEAEFSKDKKRRIKEIEDSIKRLEKKILIHSTKELGCTVLQAIEELRNV